MTDPLLIGWEAWNSHQTWRGLPVKLNDIIDLVFILCHWKVRTVYMARSKFSYLLLHNWWVVTPGITSQASMEMFTFSKKHLTYIELVQIKDHIIQKTYEQERWTLPEPWTGNKSLIRADESRSDHYEPHSWLILKIWLEKNLDDSCRSLTVTQSIIRLYFMGHNICTIRTSVNIDSNKMIYCCKCC